MQETKKRKVWTLPPLKTAYPDVKLTHNEIDKHIRRELDKIRGSYNQK